MSAVVKAKRKKFSRLLMPHNGWVAHSAFFHCARVSLWFFVYI